MTASKPSRYWTLATILLVAIIVVGVIITWLRYRPGQPLEISFPPPQELQGRIYVGGAVANPGFYPFTPKDSLEALIQAAGGPVGNGEREFKLYVLRSEATPEPQKVNINRAEVWLLEALPGIGETLAQRIVNYRQQHGTFTNISELLKVEGIGTGIYERLKHLITVAD